MDGAASVSKGTGQFSFGKLMEKNCMEAIFPRFSGFRGSLPAPLPYGNGCAALPIGRRLILKTTKKQEILYERR